MIHRIGGGSNYILHDGGGTFQECRPSGRIVVIIEPSGESNKEECDNLLFNSSLL